MQQVSWLMPVAMLPGIGLLILSTAARYGQIHGEIHHLFVHPNLSKGFLIHLKNRATLFRNALVGLYIGVGFLLLGSVAGAIVEILGFNEASGWVTVSFSFLCILTVLRSVLTLIRESRLSLEAVVHDLEALETKIDSKIQEEVFHGEKKEESHD